jgi:uncharacterized protein (TIGR02147 family)
MRIHNFNIYDHDDSRVILNSYLEKRRRENSAFSVRKWSQELGHSSHSLLALQLKGKRKVKPQHIEKFSRTMGLTEIETRYFKGITILEKSTSEEEKQYTLSHLSQSIPKRLIKTKKLKSFHLISKWSYMAIMALSELKDFVIDERSVFEKLGHRLAKSEILECLSLLVEQNLLTKDGQSYIPTYQSIVSDNDYADLGIKDYHRGACDLAKDAIDSVDINEREFQSLCLGIPKEKIPLAKELIRKFRDDFYQAMDGSGSDVYKLNIQFFQLSRSTKEQSSSVAREFADRM